MARGASGIAARRAEIRVFAATWLCYVGLVRLDTIVLQPFSDHLPDGYRAQGGRHRFAPALNFPPGSKPVDARLPRGGAASLRQPAEGADVDFRFPRRPKRAARRPCSTCRHGHGCRPRGGPDDRQPPARRLEPLDAETGEVRRFEMDRRAAQQYTETYDEFCRALQYIAMRNRGRYVGLTTDTPLEDAVFDSLVSSGGVSFR
jgi:hypothetical protein